MAPKRWICTNSSKNMVVKIVHPGGHVELHDQPLRALEVMNRNPRCIVTHPNVFWEPSSAIVPPETMLMLGGKFYVVPISTIRKLQRKSYLKSSPDYSKSIDQSPNLSSNNQPKVACKEEEKCCENLLNCWFSMNNNGRKLEEERVCNKCKFMCFSFFSKGEKGKDLSELQINELNRKSIGSPSRASSSSFELWRPSLESIVEETTHITE